jgi:hypothetical protein
MHGRKVVPADNLDDIVDLSTVWVLATSFLMEILVEPQFIISGNGAEKYGLRPF